MGTFSYELDAQILLWYIFSYRGYACYYFEVLIQSCKEQDRIKTVSVDVCYNDIK